MIRRLWPFILGGVALGLDAYVIAGLLPAISASLHADASAVGLGVAAFTGCYAVAGPLLAGRAGRNPRRSLVWALLVFALANLVTALAPGIGVFLGSRAVAGAAAGVYSPLSSAVAAALAPEEERGRALGLVLAGLALGTVFGVPLGLVVAQQYGWRVAIGLITLTGALALAGITLRAEQLPPIPASSAAQRWHAITRRQNLLTVMVTLVTAVASLGLYTYLTGVLTASPLASHQTAAIWVWGLGGAIGALGIGRVVDRARNTLSLSLAILVALAAALVTVGTAPTAWLLLVALFVWGLCGWASLAPQQHTLLLANPDDGATAVAANASANYLGSAIGATLGSLTLAAGLSPHRLPLAAAAAAGLALALQGARIRLHGKPPSASTGRRRAGPAAPSGN